MTPHHFKWPTSLFIVLTVMALASMSKAQTNHLSLIQPEDIRQVSDLFGPRFSVIGEVGSRAFLLGPRPLLGKGAPVDQHLAASFQRPIINDAEAVRADFYVQFLTRAHELDVKLLNKTSNMASQSALPYDRLLDGSFSKFNNPVQLFLVNEMGIPRSEAAEVYRAMQVGLLLGGIDGASMAFQEFLVEKINFALVRLSGEVIKMKEIKAVEMADRLLGPFTEKPDSARLFAERMFKLIHSAEESMQKSMILKMLATSKIDPKDSKRVKQFLVNSMDRMVMGNISQSTQDLLDYSNPTIRYRKGIQFEISTGLPTQSGPKTTLRNINNLMFEIMQWQLLLGAPVSEATDIIDLTIREHEKVMESRHRSPYHILTEAISTSKDQFSPIMCRNLF